ncbi:MAG: phosphatidate cytidylyltransferase [Gemmatimonadaceae bacterium]
MSELTRRIIFAVIAAPLGIAIIYLGGAALATLLAIIAALGAWEFCRMARAAGADPLDAVAIVAAAAIPLIVHGAQLRLLAPTWTQGAVVVLAIFAATIFVRGPERRPLLSTATTLFAIIYVAMIAYVYDLRYHDYVIDARSGTVLVMFPILLTWATDVGAYAFGRLFGKRKLIPSVSPGKTVAGAIGGLALTVVIAALYVRFLLHPYAQLGLTVAATVLFGATISVVAQLGDLAESLIKRDAGFKDSSTIIPGHGGVLDRFDSMLFVMPVAALLLHALLIPAPV